MDENPLCFSLNFSLNLKLFPLKKSLLISLNKQDFHGLWDNSGVKRRGEVRVYKNKQQKLSNKAKDCPKLMKNINPQIQDGQQNPSRINLKWSEVERKSFSRVQLFATPCTIQFMEFSRPEYGSGWPFPSPEALLTPGIEPRSPALQADSLPAELSRKPHKLIILSSKH